MSLSRREALKLGLLIASAPIIKACGGDKSSPTPNPKPRITVPDASKDKINIPWGVYEGDWGKPENVTRFEQNVGAQAHYIATSVPWVNPYDFPYELANLAYKTDKELVIFLVPTDEMFCEVHPRAYEDIVNGVYKEYLDEFFSVVANCKCKISVAPTEEANDSTYPWSISLFYNSVDLYKEMFRYLNSNYTSKLSHVSLASVLNNTGIDLSACVPEAADWIGVHGFNWVEYNGIQTTSVEETFENALDQLSVVKDKPIILSSVGCRQYPGKENWILEIPAFLQLHPEVRGLIYYNINETTPQGDILDWSLDSSEEAFRAFKEIVSK